MKKNKSFGFTLIELLAVIVILAVIAIIITPMIANTINNVKAGAIKASVYSIAHSSKQYCVNKQATDGKFQEKSYELNKDNATLIGFTYNASLTGIISIYSDCSVAVKATDGTYYASKSANSDDIAYGLKPVDFDPTDITVTTPVSCFATSDNGDNTVTITGYTCPNQDLIIPGTINGHAVTKIANNSFQNKGITSVNFFLMKNLVEIGPSAFAANPIESLTLKDLPALTTIETYSFAGCLNLKNVTLSNLPLLTQISYGPFTGDYVQNLNLSGLNSLTTIGNVAFSSNSLNSLTLSNLPALATIGSNAFGYNKLTSLALSNLPALTTIGDYAFTDNKLTSLTLSNLPALTTISECAFTNNLLKSINISGMPNLVAITDGAFATNPIESLTLKDLPKLTTIGGGAFYRIDANDGTKCAVTYTFDNIPAVSAYNGTTRAGLDANAFPNTGSCAGISPTVIFKNTISDPLRNYNFNNGVVSD